VRLLDRLRARLATRRAAAEVGRPIPGYYSWYMTAEEKRRWREDGWRVTYSVDPTTGHPR
jgi:hypothetical protein